MRWQSKTPKITINVAVAAAAGLCVWMGRGNVQKMLESDNYNIAASAGRMTKLVVKNPEDWNRYLNLLNIDSEAFQLLADRISDPKARLLLNVRPDARYRGSHIPAVDDALAINASAMTGAGLVGVTQEHAPPHMSVALFLQDYRATLLWRLPSADLLQQLSPDWILVDPDLLSTTALDQVSKIPGVEMIRSLGDDAGRRRLLLHYSATQHAPPASNVQQLVPERREVTTSASSLVEISAVVETVNATNPIKIAILVMGADGQPANIMDMPIIGVKPIDADRYKLQFSLIQPGQWSVYFVDPASGRRLNEEPLRVTIEN